MFEAESVRAGLHPGKPSFQEAQPGAANVPTLSPDYVH